MNLKTRLGEIKAKLSELQTVDPLGKALFGAEHHLYRVNQPASKDLINRFEILHQLILPDDYREFLLQVGNGGAGPWYGLWELAVVEDDVVRAMCEERISEYDAEHPLFEKVIPVPFSSSPKYSAITWRSENLKWLEESGYADFTEKALEIGTQGCNGSTLIVVTGVCRGEIWSVWAEEFMGFSYVSPKTTEGDDQPFEMDGEGALPFLDWYEHWLNVGLDNASE